MVKKADESISDEVNSKMTKREVRSQTYKSRIIRCAELAFIEKGFSSVTMDEIAERAGITRRTLYKHFPSKLAIYVEMTEDHLQRLLAELSKNDKLTLSAEELFLKEIDSLFKFTKENERFMRLYWIIDSENFTGDITAVILNRIQDLTREMLTRRVALLKKLMRDGEMINVDPVLLVHFVSAVNKGIFIHANKERQFTVANIGPEKLLKIFKLIIQKGLFRHQSDYEMNKKA